MSRINTPREYILAQSKIGQKIGIIIPAYNPDQHVLSDLVDRIQTVCMDYSYHILIVDDGSQQQIEVLKKNGSDLRIICHQKNSGKGAALKSGFRYFLNEQPVDLVLTLDADLQHPPQKIPEFISVYRQSGGAIITGQRQREIGIMPFHRIVSNYLTSLIISLLTGQLIRDSQCGFRLIESPLLKHLYLKENGFHLESELLVRAGWIGVRIEHVPIPTLYHKQKSSIKNVSDTLNFIRIILGLMKERISGRCIAHSEKK